MNSVTQVLFSATLLAEVLPQIWRRDPELGLQKLEKLRQLTRGALAEMRTMLLELRPSALIDTPLSDLLAQLAEASHQPVRAAVQAVYRTNPFPARKRAN